MLQHYKSPGGGHVPPGAKRLKLTKSATTAWRDSLHRQADAVPGATVRVTAAWRSLPNRQAPSSPEPHYVLALAWRYPLQPPGVVLVQQHST